MSRATFDYVPEIVQNGACLCLPATVLSVPIPIVHAWFVGDGVAVWATIETPWGSDNPCFGHFHFTEQRESDLGLEFFSEGRQVAAFIKNESFEFPEEACVELYHKSQEHIRMLGEDAAYRTIWEHHFTQYCLENGEQT